MSNILYKKANEFINFEISGKAVKIPYVLAKGKRGHFLESCGKGTPAQIKKEIIKKARQKRISLDLLSGGGITSFMRLEGIGVECSGFVYQLLDAFLKQKKGFGLARFLLRYKGHLGKLERILFRLYRARRISAHDLTSDLNTKKIEKISQLQEGDLIRLSPLKWSGKHVAIIIEITPRAIIYAHSSRDTRAQGPHFGKIEILDEEAGLEKQRWLEVTKSGENYGKCCYKVWRGDSVRRLRCLTP